MYVEIIDDETSLFGRLRLPNTRPLGYRGFTFAKIKSIQIFITFKNWLRWSDFKVRMITQNMWVKERK